MINRYTWPGNAREVVNLARRLAVIAQMESTTEEELFEVNHSCIENLLSNSPFEEQQSVSNPVLCDDMEKVGLLGSDMSMEAIEKIHIQKLIERHEKFIFSGKDFRSE